MLKKQELEHQDEFGHIGSQISIFFISTSSNRALRRSRDYEEHFHHAITTPATAKSKKKTKQHIYPGITIWPSLFAFPRGVERTPTFNGRELFVISQRFTNTPFACIRHEVVSQSKTENNRPKVT